MAEFFDLQGGEMKRDTTTLDLFEVPMPAAPVPGSQNYCVEVSHLVCEVLSQAHADRHEIAARMSRLSGRDVSKYMIDAWSAESRDGYNLPLYMAPVLEVACESHRLGMWLADKRGGRLLVGREALNAELGKLERARDEAARKIKQLKNVMGEQG